MATNIEIETLFKSNYAVMHRLASMLLHDGESAHDIVHDVFTSLMDKDTSGSVDTPYLLSSVRNRCLNRLRDIDVRERFKRLYILCNNEADECDDWPDENLLEILAHCEDWLPPKCSRVFCMRFREEMKTDEIASELGMGERMVFKHLRHALYILRLKLNQNG